MKIVIAYDGSIHAGTAVDDLRRAGLPSSAQAIVLSVIEEGISVPPGYGMVDTDRERRPVALAERWAEDACYRLTHYFPEWDVQMETRWGHPAEVVLDEAKSWPADLVVVGTHGRSTLGRVVLGSVSMKLVREAPCSVRVGRGGKPEGPIRLMIGNDGSSEAEKAVDEVCRRSWPAGTEAQIVAINEVWAPTNAARIAIGQEPYREIDDQERHWLKDASEKLAEKLGRAGLVVSSVIEEGDPKEALVEAARNWNADTIFVGARGLGRVERLLLGSVSSAIVAHAPCTVEVVRHR